MMELDDAIRHAEEVADSCEYEAYKYDLSDAYEREVAYQEGKCSEDHRQLAEWLKELKALREQKRSRGEWIPVEERLPRYNEYVLVYRPEMAIKIIVDCYDEGWTYSKDDAVVAWMPLPEPYKKEGEE